MNEIKLLKTILKITLFGIISIQAINIFAEDAYKSYLEVESELSDVELNDFNDVDFGDYKRNNETRNELRDFKNDETKWVEIDQAPAVVKGRTPAKIQNQNVLDKFNQIQENSKTPKKLKSITIDTRDNSITEKFNSGVGYEFSNYDTQDQEPKVKEVNYKTQTPKFNTDDNQGFGFNNANIQEIEAEESFDTNEVILEETQLIQDDLSMVESLKFVGNGPGKNSVVVSANEIANYDFSQTAPSEYILILPNTGIIEKAKRPIVAKKGTGLIRSVRPVVDGDNLTLRIFTNVLAELNVKSSENSLIITAEHTIDKLKSSSKSQNEDGEYVDQDDALKITETTSSGEDTTVSQIGAEADLLSEIEGSLEEKEYTGRLISLDLQETDIDNALRIIAEVSNLNIISSDDVSGKVTLRLIDVPWDQALDVILKTNALDKVQEGNVVRIAPIDKLRGEREALKQAQQAEEDLEALKVKYIRVSYAKASELQPLVEAVITERGTVAYDERTNQIIVKDIGKGIQNVTKLVQKLDLRTPQVLIETQIVESTKSFSREIGSELGFFFIRSPETGNPLGYNFPNSMEIGGSASGAPGSVSNFPAADTNSALSFLFGSADGTKGLNLRLSQAEAEGLVRVISKPSVAVTNNSPAEIKSVEKLRIRLPGGGVNVATGSGSSSNGGNGATETIEVGIVLNVTAQASPDYYVLMDIEAKSSSLGTRDRAVDDIPPELERSATSSVLVSSGQTFAIGGIYRVSEEDNIAGTPFIKDIPFIGQFFRRTQFNNKNEELIFFITPRIVEGSFDDAVFGKVNK